MVILILVVWRGFFALEGCSREGCLGVAQINLVSEDLGYLEAIWDLLGEISFWGQNSLRFDGVGPV